MKDGSARTAGPYYRVLMLGSSTGLPGDPCFDCAMGLRALGHAVVLVDDATYADALAREGALERVRQTFRPDVTLRYEGGMDVRAALGRIEGACGEAQGGSPGRRVVVFGFVGKDNFGDELVFSIIRRRVEARLPGAYFECIGHDPAATLLRHGVTSVRAEDKAGVNACLNGAAALVFMAGIVFDDFFVRNSAGIIDLYLNPDSTIAGQVAATQLAYMHHTPVMGLGLGAGPLSNVDARALVRLGSLCGPTYFTRDSHTTRLLLEAGVSPSLVRERADVAFSLCGEPLPAHGPSPVLEGLGDDGYFVVALREWSNTSDAFFDRMGALLRRAVELTGLTPCFVHFSPADEAVHRRVAALLPPGTRHVMTDSLDEALVLRLFAGSSFSVAMRLHASILSTAYGHPCVAFDYNDKIGAFFDDLGMGCALLGMDADEGRMVEALDAMWEGRELRAAAAAELACERRRLIDLAFDEALDIMASAPLSMDPMGAYSRHASLAELERDALRARVAELEAALAAAPSPEPERRGGAARRIVNHLRRRHA